MNTKEYQKRKAAIYSEFEKKKGFKLSEEVRRIIENTFLGMDRGWGPSNESLEELKHALPDFVKLLAASRRSDSGRGRPKNEREGSPPEGYRRPRERRLYLVGFVAQECLTVWNVVDRSFKPHRRINWEQVCAKWNKKHPYDPVTLKVIKATYYRAIRNPEFEREYFDRFYRRMVERMPLSVEAVIARQAFIEHREHTRVLTLLQNKLRGMSDSERAEIMRRWCEGLEGEDEHTEER